MLFGRDIGILSVCGMTFYYMFNNDHVWSCYTYNSLCILKVLQDYYKTHYFSEYHYRLHEFDGWL